MDTTPPTFTGRIVPGPDGFLPPVAHMLHRSYIGSVEVSFERDCLHGRIQGIRSLITYRARTPAELLAEFISAVDDYLADCHADGKEPEQPKGDT